MKRARIAGVAFAVFTGPCLALTLDVPSQAVLTAETQELDSETPYPVEPVAEFGSTSERLRGNVVRRSWRIPSSALTPLQIVEELKPQVSAAGYVIDFECSDQHCGGFDFRYQLDLIGEPDMHVDLGNYRYLGASKTEEAGLQAISIVASSSATTGYLHVTTVSPSGVDPISLLPSENGPPEATTGLAARLTGQGRAVLADLTFSIGSSELGAGPYSSLIALAEFLTANPGSSIVLVGHTDAAGDLSQNIALSRARAASVRERLIAEFGVPSDQVSAEGVGYLMPLASNSTGEGREVNRRVEAVLLDLN